jgi:hypothetical protein
MCAMAFHEKAGRCQVCLPKFPPSFLSGGFSERPGAVKGAFCAAQRTLDGEDRSGTMPLERKVGHGLLFLLCSLARKQPSPLLLLHCRHPSIRTLGEQLSSLGASWVFSFQPVLPPVRRPVFHRQE